MREEKRKRERRDEKVEEKQVKERRGVCGCYEESKEGRTNKRREENK